MHAHRHTHLAWLTVLAALTAILLAACGGSNGPSGSSSGGAQPKTFAGANPEKFPACMRGHGVTNFPDPHVNGNSVTIHITPAISESPAFKSARQACSYLLPVGAGQINLSPAQQNARTAGFLAFAGCMRKHGFPSFPDPTGQGRLTLEMVKQAGIDLQQPAVLQAGDACVSVSRGQITKANVAQAVANPGASGSQTASGG